MAVVEVGGALLRLVDTIQRSGNDYYKASAAWQKFPRQVRLLQARQADLKARLDRFGEDLDPSVLKVCEDAKQLLQEEVDRLQRRDASGKPCRYTCFGRVGEILFPAKIGQSVKNVIDAYDDILEHLRSKAERDQVAMDGLRNKPYRLSFSRHNQSHHVQLGCEGRVHSALKEVGESCPRIVLLYGGPGTGKTTVVRQVSLSCDEDKSDFEQVLYLECGMTANLQDLEIRLLQKLGWDEASELTQKYSHQDVRTGRLQNLLSRGKLLIVLDDLWGSQLLERLLNLSGPGVKILASSQQGDLCVNLECRFQCIQIDDLQISESEKMLAIHAGFPDQHIPDHLKEITQTLLREAEGIPLIIATLGAQVTLAGETDNIAVWQCALNNFVQSLNQEPPSKSTAGVSYSRNYWSALKSSIDWLSIEEKRLLFLICMCRGPSVPEHTLRIFCCTTLENCNLMTFLRWKKKLKSANLVFEKVNKVLSVHMLTKKLVEEYMQESLVSIMQCFLEKGSSSFPSVFQSLSRDAQVILVLVCIYVEPKLGDQLASQIGLESTEVDAVTIVEPITTLIVPEALSQGHSTGELHVSASKVLLEFIYNNALDQDHISRLLNLPEGFRKTSEFLRCASMLGGPSWENINIGAIPETLLRIFQDSACPDFQLEAAICLGDLCLFNGQTREDVVNTPGMLDHVIHSLFHAQNPRLKFMTGRILTSAASNGGAKDSKVALKIASFPNFLEMMRAALANDEQSALQAIAAGIIVNLTASDESITSRIFAVPALLEDLFKAMDQEQNLALASCAALAVSNLIREKKFKARFSDVDNIPNLLKRLRTSLSKVGNPGLQFHAAWALDNLAEWGKSMRMEILNFPGLLDDLVTAINQKQNTSLAAKAALAMCRLAGTPHSPKMLTKIACSSDLLENLGSSLTNAENPQLQLSAAVLLANLGLGDDSIKRKILSFPGLLIDLVKAMEQIQNLGHLKTHAAGAISNLVNTEDVALKNTVASHPNLLKTVGASFSDGGDPSLQLNAMAIICNLASGGRSIREKILTFPGILMKLVKAVDQDRNLELAYVAAEAIQSLACPQDSTPESDVAESDHKLAYEKDCSIQCYITSFPDVLKTLSASLSKVENTTLQVLAAGAIAHLGTGDQSTKEKILRFPGLLDNLVKAVHQGHNSNLAQAAAVAISNLSVSEDLTLRGHIAHHPSLLESLGACLSKGSNPDLQVIAAAAIGCIGAGDQSTKERILSIPGLIEKLLKAMRDSRNASVAEFAAKAIFQLTATEDLTMKSRIAHFPNFVNILRISLTKDRNPGLQFWAACAVKCLGDGDASVTEKIVNTPGLLDQLVKAMDHQKSELVPVAATMATETLAATNVIKRKIVRHPFLLKNLEVSLSKVENPDLQLCATRAIGNMASGDQYTKEKIFSFPALLDRLVAAVDQDQNILLGEEAARSLDHMADTEDSTMKKEIEGFPNLVCSLRKALSRSQSSALQKYAASALEKLGK